MNQKIFSFKYFVALLLFALVIHKAQAEVYPYQELLTYFEKNLGHAQKLSKVEPFAIVKKVARPKAQGEINNSEIVDLSFDGESIIIASDDQNQPSNQLTRDDVTQSMASVKKENTADSDDIVVFDYGSSKESEEKESPLTAKMNLSSAVKSAIERELHKKVSTPKSTKSTLVASSETDEEFMNELLKDENVTVFDYAKKKAPKKTNKDLMGEALKELSNPKAFNAETVLKVRELDLVKGKYTDLSGFEFVPDYNRSQRESDANTGEIRLQNKVTDDHASLMTGVIQVKDYMPTRVDINVLDRAIEIPVLSERSIVHLLEKKDVVAQGNVILVSINEGITDVEIDSKYAVKIYLDNKLKPTTDAQKADYVLFIGTQDGNTLVQYLLADKQSATKIIYVGEGEVYFDNSVFTSSQRELFTLTTRSLLGKTVKELNIDGSQVMIYGSSNKAAKRTINSYEIRVPKMPMAERKYLEFKHLRYPLYVGTTSQEIEVPGDDFIDKVMQVHEIENMGQRCMVQVNLQKDLKYIEVNGKNSKGEMLVDTTYLDRDGNFTTDNMEWAEKVFFLGDLEGMFNAKIEYVDGSVHYLKTFCSQGSYIIEQI